LSIGDLQAALVRLLGRVLGVDGVRVEGLRRLSGGASRETWSFMAVSPEGGTRALILRRDPPDAPKEGMGLEARLLAAAATGKVPVPAVLASSDDAEAVGSPFLLMEHVDGETIPRKILREAAFDQVRPRLAGQCGEILARLHAVDPEQVEGLEGGDQLARYREVLDELGEPHPAFELAFRWLEGNRPPPGPETIVHGDFRHGNLIIGPDRVRAVIDWELGHRGDPMEDLGWLCVKAWRFGKEPPVGGFGSYEQLIDGYEGAGGRPVDRDGLRWWETFGVLRWGIICMMQANTHTSGTTRSVELAAIGRRVCENEWDLLDMLDL
jgi:aminoglycoside phosphotransferase (APT) family kinase protein